MRRSSMPGLPHSIRCAKRAACGWQPATCPGRFAGDAGIADPAGLGAGVSAAWPERHREKRRTGAARRKPGVPAGTSGGRLSVESHRARHAKPAAGAGGAGSFQSGNAAPDYAAAIAAAVADLSFRGLSLLFGNVLVDLRHILRHHLLDQRIQRGCGQ